jgi:hypothetical protein
MKIWGFGKEISRNVGHYFMKNPLNTSNFGEKFDENFSKKEVTLNEYNIKKFMR